METANLSEVFTSIQGEGIYVGRRQVFVRFSGCNLECEYCDTPDERYTRPSALFEDEPFSGTFKKIENPIAVNKLAEFIHQLCNSDRSIHSISLTGGEPLLNSDFISELCAELKGVRPIHLETNGSLPTHLEKVVHCIAFVSMDLKTNYYAEHGFIEKQKEFLKLASRQEVQAKIVIGSDTKSEMLETAFDIVAAVDTKIPVILQPMTGHEPRIETLFDIQTSASSRLDNVLIIPQTHKYMGIK